MSGVRVNKFLVGPGCICPLEVVENPCVVHAGPLFMSYRIDELDVVIDEVNMRQYLLNEAKGDIARRSIAVLMPDCVLLIEARRQNRAEVGTLRRTQ
jgi:hypothetical protein